MAETVYFDYVSADLLAEIIGGADTKDTGPDQSSASFSGRKVDSFFEKFGLTDVVLFHKSAQKTAQPPISSVFQNLFESGAVRYYKGVEIEAANENELYAQIRKERPKSDFLAVRSDDEKIIRAAADSVDVDAVIPVSNSTQKPAAGRVNHIVAKIAADKKTAFAFDIAPFLFVKGYRRSKLFSDVAEMIPILRKYHVPVLLFSGAGNTFEIRGPYELEAFGRLFGMTQEETVFAVGEFPRKILSDHQKKVSGKLISQGVEVFFEEKSEK